MNKIFFLVGLTILAVASARVVRDAPNPEFSFDNLLKNFQEGMNTLESTFLKTTGASDPEDFKRKTDEYLGNMAKKWDSWVQDANTKTKDLENVPAVQELRSSMQKVMDEFAKEHPAAAEDVSKYMGKFKENTEEVMHKIKEMGDSDESKKLKEVSESLLASAQEQFNQMAAEMKEKFANQ